MAVSLANEGVRQLNVAIPDRASMGVYKRNRMTIAVQLAEPWRTRCVCCEPLQSGCELQDFDDLFGLRQWPGIVAKVDVLEGTHCNVLEMLCADADLSQGAGQLE